MATATYNTCTHASGWTHHAGEARCDACGVRRFTEYRAVRPSGLPVVVTQSLEEAHAADRAAATWIAQMLCDEGADWVRPGKPGIWRRRRATAAARWAAGRAGPQTAARGSAS
ncbi:hypothetical protein GCM10010218_17810 [Streptomyces mashuensis]|uniref:Uncharacterized protein n=1 Tax=Streptomyces mashuensis TaxID=33904 RepID=A0A919B0M6_9ACTN|nr:DUF6255 family natural product biosynthesis protein [Streptomyces mashuensis]GHF36705.1 hypothetical protein GCM10010218_17810 [Streptomyces mashuensis]